MQRDEAPVRCARQCPWSFRVGGQGGWGEPFSILPLPVTLRAPPTPNQGQRSPARQRTQPREPALGSGLSSPGPGQPLLSWLLAPAPTPATCRRALAPLGGLSGGGAPAQCRAARAALAGGRVTATASLSPRACPRALGTAHDGDPHARLFPSTPVPVPGAAAAPAGGHERV